VFVLFSLFSYVPLSLSFILYVKRLLSLPEYKNYREQWLVDSLTATGCKRAAAAVVARTSGIFCLKAAATQPNRNSEHSRILSELMAMLRDGACCLAF
jgi:hypothetical protein